MIQKSLKSWRKAIQGNMKIQNSRLSVQNTSTDFFLFPMKTITEINKQTQDPNTPFET